MKNGFGVVHKAGLPPTPKPISSARKATNAIRRAFGSKTVPPPAPKQPIVSEAISRGQNGLPPTPKPIGPLTRMSNSVRRTLGSKTVPPPLPKTLSQPQALSQPKAPEQVKQAIGDKKKSGATDWIKNNKLKTTGIVAGGTATTGGAYYLGTRKNRNQQ